MKKIKFTCPHCQAKLRVPTHLAGISAPCPKCGRKITAPTDLASVVDDDPAPTPRTVPEERKVPSPSIPAPSTVSQDAPPSPLPAPSPVAAPASAPVTPAVAAAAAPAVLYPPTAEAAPEIAPPSPHDLPNSVPTPSEPVDEAPSRPEPIIEETILTPPPAPPTVSEPTSPAAQPPLEKTEPIQIRPLPSTLPEVREEVVPGETSLPRLDAERANQQPSGLEALLAPPSTPGAPTKLQLPQAGDLTGEQSPGDFVVPAPEEPVESPAAEMAVPEPMAVPLPEDVAATEIEAPPVIPELSDLDLSAPGIPMDELGELESSHESYEAPPLLEEPVAIPEASVPNSLEIPAELEMPEEFDPAVEDPTIAIPSFPSAETEVEPLLEPSLAPEPESDFLGDIDSPNPAPEADAPASVAPSQEGLSGGSMERLFASSHEEIDATVPIQPIRPAETPKPIDELDALFESPKKSQAPVPEPVVPSDTQSLEEMFGELPGEGGNKKLTKVVMLSMIGAVAIITLVVVILGINAAGGLKPQISSNQTELTPPPRISEIPPTNSAAIQQQSSPPQSDEAPAMIDPVAQDRGALNNEGIIEATSSDASIPSDPLLYTSEPPARIVSPSSSPPDPPALSFDERVQQIVSGNSSSGAERNIIGGEPEPVTPSPLESLDDTIANFEEGAKTLAADVAGTMTGGQQAAEADAAPSSYNPPAAFPAPGADESPLSRTHDLLDAFLRAPDWDTRILYTYQGESLRPTIEEYYKKWPVNSFDRFSLTLFQMEQDATLGGPYWVYLVSTNDLDQGYPVIIREEEGNLKVDWEIYSEFQDQHFVEFQNGAIASPHSFRLVLERVSDYFGADRDEFTNLDDFFVYQINPPYGDLSEYSEYAFVKKDSALAGELEEIVGLNDEALAVIVTIEQKMFPHGKKHIEITDLVTEGWFR